MQIKEKVKKLGLPKVIALAGERALVDEGLVYLREEAGGKESFELNHHRYAVSEQDLSELITVLNTMPFLAPRRIVELHNAEKLDASTVESIIKYLENPSPSSLFIIIFNKLDKRSKLSSALSEKGFLSHFEPPKEADLVQLALGEAQALSLQLPKAAAQFLVLMLDQDLLAIKSAIKKLALLPLNTEITIDVIEQHIISTKEEDIFILARWVAEGQLSPALLALAKIREKENAIKFLGVMAWQLRTLLHIRHCIDAGMHEADQRKAVSVFGDRFTWMAALARKKPMDFHVQRLTRLLACDAALKSLNTAEPFNLLEKMVYQSAVGL